MKRVLVPLEGTQAAETALPFLEQVCTPGDSVVLLSVSKPDEPARVGTHPGREIPGGFAGPSGGVTGTVTPDTSVFVETKDQSTERQINEVHDYLEDLAVGPRLAGFDVKTDFLVADDPAKAILQYARAMKPTLIAFQHRPQFGLRELLLGSFAKRLVQAEIAPVLFVSLAARDGGNIVA